MVESKNFPIKWRHYPEQRYFYKKPETKELANNSFHVFDA